MALAAARRDAVVALHAMSLLPCGLIMRTAIISICLLGPIVFSLSCSEDGSSEDSTGTGGRPAQGSGGSGTPSAGGANDTGPQVGPAGVLGIRAQADPLEREVRVMCAAIFHSPGGLPRAMSMQETASIRTACPRCAAPGIAHSFSPMHEPTA